MTHISDDMLMAYADGELSGEDVQRVKSALETDPDLQAKLDRHIALKTLIDEGVDAALQAPMPAGLIASIEADKAADISQETERHRPNLMAHIKTWWDNALLPDTGWQGAVASAAVALAVVAVLVETTDQTVETMPQQLVAALDSWSDNNTAGGVTVQNSYLNGAGQFCRTFSERETLKKKGLACRNMGGAWTLVASRDLPPENAFLPAGADDDIMAALTKMHALPDNAETRYLKAK